MQTRLKGLQRIALVYVAVKHAQALALEQAAMAVREAESQIEQERSEVRRSKAAGREALDAGEHLTWKMHESQGEFTGWNAAGLAALRERRETLMMAAADLYRAGRMQLEQMESVLGELRSKADSELARKEQRESDDRFLSQQWWQERSVRGVGRSIARGDAVGPDT